MLASCTYLVGALRAAHLDGFEGKRFPLKPNSDVWIQTRSIGS
jgi:hypothetical protein